MCRSPYPGELYTPSVRVYERPDEPDYPYHDRTVRVTRWGRICIAGALVNEICCKNNDTRFECPPKSLTLKRR